MRKNVSTAEPVFCSNEVVRMFGVSLRQLQWWDEHGVIKPRHEGHTRLWTEVDAVEVGVMVQLRKKRISLQRGRKLLRRAGADILRLFTDPTCPVHLWLLIPQNPRSKPDHLVESDEGSIVRIIAHHASAVYAVSISDALSKVKEYASARDSKHKSARR